MLTMAQRNHNSRPVSLYLRGYATGDLAALHAMDQNCFPPGIAFTRPELLSCLNHRNSVVRIAVLDEQIVGFAVGMTIDHDAGHVVTLDVVREGRRQGIGTTLMSALHDEFRQVGASLCFLEVDVENAAARRFYETLQYKYVEYLPGYYQNHGDAYRMVRDLAGSASAT